MLNELLGGVQSGTMSGVQEKVLLWMWEAWIGLVHLQGGLEDISDLAGR